jgi:hypothetical protein
MNLKALILGEEPASPRMPSEFDVKIERRTSSKDVLQFDARVKGYFIGKGGKPDFVAETIHILGIPDMNIRQFFSAEIKEVKKYALSVELPKTLGKKLR